MFYYLPLPTPTPNILYFIIKSLWFRVLVGLRTFETQIYMTHKPACTGLSFYAGLTFYSLCLIEIVRVLESQCFLLFFVLIDIHIIHKW